MAGFDISNNIISGKVDDVTMTFSETGDFIVKDLGVDTAQLAAGAVTTAKIADDNVTYAKIQDVSATAKLLGRTTAGAGVVEEVALIDDDTMGTATNTNVATSESIKAYVDINTLTYVDELVSSATSVTPSKTNLDLSGTAIGANRALVVLSVVSSAVPAEAIFAYPLASGINPYPSETSGANSVVVGGATDQGGYLTTFTDAGGKCEWVTNSGTINPIVTRVVAYQLL